MGERMPNGTTALERAFELARSGRYENVGVLRAALKAEGYAYKQIEGPSLLRQLREIMNGAGVGNDRQRIDKPGQ